MRTIRLRLKVIKICFSYYSPLKVKPYIVTPLCAYKIFLTHMLIMRFNPKNVNTITLFLTEMIPEDCGVALYYSVPPFNSKQFIKGTGHFTQVVSFGLLGQPQFLHLIIHSRAFAQNALATSNKKDC